LVLILTRKPWVFRRWRLFGWNVRLPFMVSPEAAASRTCARGGPSGPLARVCC
jgi:hypothetical protein